MTQRINKVVIVDDDDINNFISKRLIEKLKITTTIITLKNGKEALEYIEKKCLLKEEIKYPDLVLMDNTMPGIDGIEVFYELKNKGISYERDIVFVMLSANQLGEDMQKQLKDLGVNEYIVKPLTEEKINKILEKYF